MRIAKILTVAAIGCLAALFALHGGFAQQAAAAAAAAPPAAPAKPATKPAGAHDFAKWEKEISDYEKADRDNPPPKDGVLFIGSSTIRLWKTLAADYPNHKVINRGFGGSEIVDSTHFADRVIFPYEPKQIFLRAGGNDIHAGRSADQVFGDYKDFVAAVHKRLPETEIIYISLSPSIARWSELEQGKVLNALIAEYVKDKPRLKYCDTHDMVLGADGKPRAELFVDDKLHFNAEGYKLLTEKVRPYLGK